MATEPDYYSALGVAPGSEDVVIQAAYRALMRRYHPDKNASADAARKTIEINAAYAVLNDPAARAAYDARRDKRSKDSQGSSQPRTPPPPPGGQTGDPSSGGNGLQLAGRQSGGLIFASILTIVILAVALDSSNTKNASLNTMNVDEDLTTTDLNVTTDMNATDMNAADMNLTETNAVEAVAADLSKQPQTVVSYSTVEDAANRVAKLIVTKGISGARTYSENCHKTVQSNPSWDGADSCAAFDYAAAYIDNSVSSQAGWPRNGYFDFQSGNQSDDYEAAGAPSYVMGDRLSKIRSAAQQAAAEAFRAEVAKMRAEDGPDQPTSTTSESENSE